VTSEQPNGYNLSFGHTFGGDMQDTQEQADLSFIRQLESTNKELIRALSKKTIAALSLPVVPEDVGGKLAALQQVNHMLVDAINKGAK
jgi:hypothetical protein